MTRDIARYLANWQAEVDSTLQYEVMARHEPDRATARVYQQLARMEQRHIDFWEIGCAPRATTPGRANPAGAPACSSSVPGAGERRRCSKPWRRTSTRP